MKIDSIILDIAKSMYTNEPCRICGKNILDKDIDNGAVFAGYSKNCESRSAHKSCWATRPEMSKWAYPNE